MGMVIGTKQRRFPMRFYFKNTLLYAVMLGNLYCGTKLAHADWQRFRGPNGQGVAAEASLPTTWSDRENLKWKTPLPGPGSSSPIVVGDKVFVTCYSGYGEDAENPGEITNLKRHLVCLSLVDGELQWDKTVDSSAEEDPYKGFISEHGYASNTPVSDGKNVYVFHGKSGVFAYDLAGNQLWQRGVGESSGPQKWGSAGSPILCGDLLIVNASEESSSLVALNTSDGSVAWELDSKDMASNWSTPIVVEADGRTELILGVAKGIWALDPATGNKLWTASSTEGRSKVSSLVAVDDMVISMGGREQNTIAVRVGGEGDVSETNVVWDSNERGGIGTPVAYDGHLYWFTRGIARCASLATGEVLYEERYKEQERRRGPGGADYCSPIAAGNVYFLTRQGKTYVVKPGPEYELLATNSFESDESQFNGTPAVAEGCLLIRSDEFLYCVGK